MGWPNNNSGGSATTTQTLTPAAATTGITITSGANVVRISPAISANANFAITGGSFGDSLTLFVPQDSTGLWELIVDGDLFTDDVTNIANSQIMIQMVNDGTSWNVSNSPQWN